MRIVHMGPVVDLHSKKKKKKKKKLARDHFGMGGGGGGVRGDTVDQFSNVQFLFPEGWLGGGGGGICSYLGVYLFMIGR